MNDDELTLDTCKTVAIPGGDGKTVALFTPNTVVACQVTDYLRRGGDFWLFPFAQRPRDRSKYQPHQGKAEAARRRRQRAAVYPQGGLY